VPEDATLTTVTGTPRAVERLRAKAGLWNVVATCDAKSLADAAPTAERPELTLKETCQDVDSNCRLWPRRYPEELVIKMFCTAARGTFRLRAMVASTTVTSGRREIFTVNEAKSVTQS